jgi:hypothetical protein
MRDSTSVETPKSSQDPTIALGARVHIGDSASQAAPEWGLGVPGGVTAGCQRAGGAFRSRALKVSQALMSPVR